MSVYPAPYSLGVYPDILGDVRAWLRTHPWLTGLTNASGGSLLNARVFFRIPDTAVFPLIRIYDAGTTQQPGLAPIVDARIGVDVWGQIGNSNATYANVKDIANAVSAAFHYLAPGTLLGTTTVALNADPGTALDNPDPDTGDPRKTITVTVTARVKTDNG